MGSAKEAIVITRNNDNDDGRILDFSHCECPARTNQSPISTAILSTPHNTQSRVCVLRDTIVLALILYDHEKKHGT